MGRLREAFAILIKPNDTLLYPETQQHFRGRARVSHASGTNNLVIVALVVCLLLIIGSWIFTGFGLFRQTDDPSRQPPEPPPIQQGRGTSGVSTGFPKRYEPDPPPPPQPTPRPIPEIPAEPVKPMLATVTTNSVDPSLAAIRDLTQAMTAMAGKMHQLEGKVDQLGKTPTRQTAPAQTATAKAHEDHAKSALDARRSGPLWMEKKKDKDGISYYRRGRLGEYRLAAGWNIPILLQDEASNQSPGLYGFTVREAVYDSATGERVVLPQYSYGLVQITGGQLFGDVELPATLVALNLHDGTPIKVGGTSVGDAAARSGFRDQVDHRTWNVILTTIVRSGLRIGTVGMLGGATGDIADRAGAAVVNEGMRETANQVQQFANTSPIHTVRPGYLGTIKVKDPIDVGMLHAIR